MRNLKTLAMTLILALSVSPVMSEEVASKPDGSWISLSGIATEAGIENFELDYGEGQVVVEMDTLGWEAYEADPLLFEGHEVTVYGRVDDDLFDKATIEAGSVYDHTLHTYFYADAVDEESGLFTTVYVDDNFDDVTLRGTVSEVDGREFTIDHGILETTVDTSYLGYNPMDDSGFQKIEVGDRVKVGGELDLNVIENQEVNADWIVTLGDS